MEDYGEVSRKNKNIAKMAQPIIIESINMLIIKKNYIEVPVKERGKIYNLLSFTDSIYSKKLKKFCTFSDSYLKNGHCLLGFLDRIKKEFPNLEIKEKSPTYKIKYPKIKGVTFRPDQIKMILSGLKNKRGILIAHTGYGKTHVAGGLMAGVDYPCLFVVNSTDLLHQAYKDFSKWFSCYKIGDGNKIFYPNKKVCIATIQTLKNIKKIPINFNLIIVDEAHNITGINGQWKIISNINAGFVLGLTATPPKAKKEALALEGLIGPVIHDFTLSEGVKKGFVVPPYVEIYLIDDIETKRTGDFSKDYTNEFYSGLINNKQRNKKIIKIALNKFKKGESVLVFCSLVEHIIELKKCIKKEDLKYFSFLTGNSSSEKRNNVKKLLSKKRKIVISTIWKEGIDIPSLDCGILADVGKSYRKIMQSIGRMVRTFKGKKKCTVIDFNDGGYYLLKHSNKRISEYKKMKWIITMKKEKNNG